MTALNLSGLNLQGEESKAYTAVSVVRRLLCFTYFSALEQILIPYLVQRLP